MIVMGTSGPKYYPQLVFSKVRYTSFEKWWNTDIVLVDSKRNIFTRRKIVCEIANTDGGAHVDPSLKEPYYDVSQANSLGWIHHDERTGIDRVLNDPIPPCIRQISYETLLTFNKLDIAKEVSK
jgi:hypothetical protein